MKTTCISVVCLLIVLLVARAECTPIYQVIGLGTLGGTYSGAWAINDKGEVAGVSSRSDGQYHAFIWRNGTMSDLSTLGVSPSWGYGINESSQVVGYSQTTSGYNHGFLWGGSTGIIDLGVGSGRESESRAINDNSQIAGTIRTLGDAPHAALWQEGSWTDLGTLGGYGSFGNAINNQGKVVGYAEGPGGGRAFLWENNQMISLGTLGGSWSESWGINDSNQIIGRSELSSSLLGGFLWQNGSMIDLHVPGNACPLGINNSGQIVGFSERPGGMDAFFWESGVSRKLSDMVPNSGWEFITAWAINDSGQIAGEGRYNGQVQAFLMSPVPEPSSILALCGGVAGLLAFRRRRQ